MQTGHPCLPCVTPVCAHLLRMAVTYLRCFVGRQEQAHWPTHVPLLPLSPPLRLVQFSGGKVDEKCDVFSFSVLCWEALTGAVPWQHVQVRGGEGRRGEDDFAAPQSQHTTTRCHTRSMPLSNVSRRRRVSDCAPPLPPLPSLRTRCK